MKFLKKLQKIFKMNNNIIVWNKNNLIKINEAIEFDSASSYNYVFDEIFKIIKLLNNKGVFLYEEKEISSIEDFMIFIDDNISNPIYLKNNLPRCPDSEESDSVDL